MLCTIANVFVGIGIWVMITVQSTCRIIESCELISLLILLWSLGTVFGSRQHLKVIVRMLDPIFKLSVISFLSFRSGLLGLFPLIIYVIYALGLGWIQGLVLMAREIAGLRRSNG